MEVYWLQQTGADVPPLDDWLSQAEVSCLRAMRFEKRRADWRLGRWTAKAAASVYLRLPRDSGALREIEVRPEPGGAPVLWIGAEPAPVTMSLSHRDGVAVCAIAPPGVELGYDLEVAEPKSPAFVADYFTRMERAYIEQAPAWQRPRRTALLWSAKESTLKALRVGLRMDTREVAVGIAVGVAAALDGDQWRPLRISCQRRSFEGWWRSAGQFVHTVVASPWPAVPSRLRTK